jgi:hypothetical protein
MKVIFRKFKKDCNGSRYPLSEDIIAFLPEIKEVNPSMMMSYMHIGQHGEADYYGLLRDTVLASQVEYMPLLKELEGIYGEPIKPIFKYNRR